VILKAATAEEMKALGARLGRVMRVGDVVGLVGGLGAGKTTLTQGIAVGLEVEADRHVASPTFALVNEHPARVPFVRADLYRLRNEAELAELGLDEIFDRACAVIEWIDLFPQAVPADSLRVTIVSEPDTDTSPRTLTFAAGGPVSARLLASLSPAL
jgi:tRNA threonylcarbamoyladenosine biosynthesis protein TsaE